jgi:CRP-like cAMP-binding protein
MEHLQSMFRLLREHIAKHVTLTEKEYAQCASFFIPKVVRKGQFLLQEKEICRYLTFVTTGMLRSFAIDEKGEEHIVEFAFEGWWISDMYSFLTGQPSAYFIDALENTEALLIDLQSYENLCSTIPGLERYFRILLQNNYIASHRRILASISLSAEDQYKQLLAICPTIGQRIAQRHIASYLGITPEALSRIRNRLSRNSRTKS